MELCPEAALQHPLEYWLNPHRILPNCTDASSFDEIKEIDAFLGYPEKNYPCVHVTGTNGKGSVCFKIAKALSLAGYKVGLYTSPHITCVEERIQINNIPISTSNMQEIFGYIKERIGEKMLSLHFFSLLTLIAFIYFQKEKVDIAVIEVGKGGEFDATNVVNPLLTVITSIADDHMAELGGSLQAIARAKAGIIKPHTPLVLGPEIEYAEIIQKAMDVKAPIFPIKFKELFYEETNQSIARKALELLPPPFMVEKTIIDQAVLLRPPCRFEKKGAWILDVAHNLAGIQALIQALELFYPSQKAIFVLGLNEDKKYKEILSLLISKALFLYLVESSCLKAQSIEKMQNYVDAGLGFSFVETSFSTQEAMQKAEKRADKIGGSIPLVVTGTFYIMQEAVSNFLSS